jgi:hypothetical protein
MGIFQAVAIYRLAKLRQRELELCFADMGVVYADCLDTKFMKGWVQEAMETDAVSVAEKYRFIVTDTMMRCGPKVTARFNGTLAELNEAKQRREALARVTEDVAGTLALARKEFGDDVADDMAAFLAEKRTADAAR